MDDLKSLKTGDFLSEQWNNGYYNVYGANLQVLFDSPDLKIQRIWGKVPRSGDYIDPWAETATKRLQTWGFNALGTSCDPQVYAKHRQAYIPCNFHNFLTNSF